MKYDIHLRREVPAGRVRQRVVAAARAALAQARARPGALSVVLTDSRRIRRLNARYAGEDHVTDVLAFPTGGFLPEGHRPYFGDVVIALPRARRQARERGVPLVQELTLLTVHGTLHLLGYDHHDPVHRKRMWAVQTLTLRRLGLDPARFEP